MRSFLTTLTVLFLTGLTAFCQLDENTKSREVFLSTQSLTSNFGMQFKISLNSNTYFRLGLFELRANQINYLPATTNTFPNHQFSSRGQIKIGIEKRRVLFDNGTFFYGLDLMNSTLFNRTKIDNPSVSEDLRKMDDWKFSSGIGIVLGFAISLRDNFSFATEIEPEFLYLYESNQVPYETFKNKKTGFDINLDSEVIKLSLIYKWDKQD